MRASAPMVVQRLLNAGERGPIEVRCLALEQRIEAATGSLPDIIQRTFGADHPVIDSIRDQLRHVRAPFGVNDSGTITAKLDEFERTIVAVEGKINANLAQIDAVARVWVTFAAELTDLTGDLAKITKAIYESKIDASLLDEFDRKLQRKVALDSKGMSKLRAGSVEEAKKRVGDYISLGYVQIDQVNKFYASSYDADEDDFGASASLTNNTTSGAMQWLREWEFHIHASVVRAGGSGTPVTGFTIKTGHIKPSKVASLTGTSITLPAAVSAAVIANSTPIVVRWANSNRGAPILRRQWPRRA